MTATDPATTLATTLSTDAPASPPLNTLADFAGILEDLAMHAEQVSPRECCGLIIRTPLGLVYFPCLNLELGEAGRDRFVICPADYARAEDLGDIVAIAHSHPHADANPSEADRVMCERTGLPWLIMGWPSQVATLTLPAGYEAPLIGRSFAHGILDCYTLLQDYYERTLGIALPHFERADDWWVAKPGAQAQDLYATQFDQAGFVQVNGPPQPHDVLLMQVRSDRLNHAAVYLGDSRILHHLHSRPSCEDIWGGYWERHTGMIVRHREVIERRAKGDLP